MQIDRTLLSRHLGLFLWIHSNLSPSVYWTWCWSQGITGRISLWCSIGHGPCSPRRSSHSCSDCIYYFLADWPFHGWILRSKWYYRWSSHIHSNSVSSREPLELNRLVRQDFFFSDVVFCEDENKSLGGELATGKWWQYRNSPHKGESPEPQGSLPSLGVWQQEVEPPESGFECQQLLIAGFLQHQRKHQLHSWVICTLAPREK